jgi:PHS family inorganic phosphate transporter-like MFS transporter
MDAQPDNVEVAVPPLTLSQCRTGALEIIDNANFSWFHFKVCMVAGIGFFTDAYVIIVS